MHRCPPQSIGYAVSIIFIVLSTLLIWFRPAQETSPARQSTSRHIAQQREESGGGGSKQLTRMTGEIDRRNLIANFDLTTLCTPHGRFFDEECIVVSESSLPTASPAFTSTIKPSNQTTEDMCSRVPCNQIKRPPSDQAVGCLLKFWRSNEAACPQSLLPTTDATPDRSSMHHKLMCPCATKRVVAVPLVTILAMLAPCSGCVAIHMIIAVTKTPLKVDAAVGASSEEDHNNSHGNNHNNVTHTAFHLIDLAASHFVYNPCWLGERPTLQPLAPTLTQMMSHLIGVINSSRYRSKNSSRRSTTHRPWSCSVLREHRLARGGSHNDLELGEVAPPVFYALDIGAGVSGHSLESIFNGIGHYVAEGLRDRQIPWLVPCSDEWDIRAPQGRSPLIWTEFFLQLNEEALQFPFYPVDFHKHFDVDSPSFSPLLFSTVHFASAHSGVNALCFRKILQSLLWRHAVRLEGERNWSVSSTKRFEARHYSSIAADERQNTRGSGGTADTGAALTSPAKVQHDESVNNTTATSLHNTSGTFLHLSNRWQPNRRIAFLKMISSPHLNRQNSSPASPMFTSPHRSYPYSLEFDRLLLERGILPLSPTLPLFERMWHVNTAELIVTTWGSTTTIVYNLLFERELQHNNRTDDSGDERGARRLSEAPPQRPLRILVLVHPSYCHEAVLAFRTTRKYLCPRRSSSKKSSSSPPRLLSIIHKHKVSRNSGDTADHYGGQDFCVKYLLTKSLSFVQSHELDFC